MVNVIASMMLVGMLAKEPRCIRWTWSGDVYNRKVICLEWDKPPSKNKEPKKNA